MGDVVSLKRGGWLAQERKLADIAQQLIDQLGDEVGYRVGVFARSASLDPAARKRLLAIVDEVERQQGFGWFFAEDCERKVAP